MDNNKEIAEVPQSPMKPGAIYSLQRLIQSRLLPEAYKAMGSNSGRANRFRDNMGMGLSAMADAHSVLNNGKGFNDPPPKYGDRLYPNQGGWQHLILEEFAQFNAEGSAYITRVSECVIKVFGLINAHHGAMGRKLALFRGQHNAEWKIQSSIGLKIQPDKVPDDRSVVSEFELYALHKWQDRVLSDSVLTQEVFGESEPHPKLDPRWWALKQHYDDDVKTGGSRLIDWSSSPFCGLYFACANWDGSIDENIDGSLFALMSRAGRPFASEDYIGKRHFYERDLYDKAGATVADYFTILKHVDYVRTVISESESHRQIAQDGHFVFSPHFEEPIIEWPGSQPFCFVIPGNRKASILRELYSVGYTPQKIVRGQKGSEAHRRLVKTLGIEE